MKAFLENANIFRLARPAEKAAINSAAVGNKESSDTHTLLTAKVNKLYTRWGATEQPNEAVVPDREHHEVMSPERVQAASRTFKQNTTTSLDGIHPKHIGMLCDYSAHVTALLYAAMEAAGMLPAQVQFLTFRLIPKPSGGHKWVLGQSAFFRVWEETKKEYCQEYVRNDRTYWGIGHYRSPEMLVFIEAAKL